MAQAVNVNFRMDAELKKNMEQVCEDMGLSMTTAFTIFAKKVRLRQIRSILRAIWRICGGELQHLIPARE